jgi:hypothetical protein
MSPLVHGRYPVYSPAQVAAGGQAGNAQTNGSWRSNLELMMFFGLGAQVDTASLGGTTSGTYVSTICPVDVGAKYSTISILIGATGASTPTHGYAALYSGTAVAAPPLIVQSVDQTTAAMAASTRFDYTLPVPTVITPAMAPYGYLNVAIVSTVTTTVASCVTVPVNVIAATGYAWFTGTPKAQYLAQTATAANVTAPATLANTATLSVAPIVFLS